MIKKQKWNIPFSSRIMPEIIHREKRDIKQDRVWNCHSNEFVTNGHHQGNYSRINYLPNGPSTWLTSQGIEKMLGIPKMTDAS